MSERGAVVTGASSGIGTPAQAVDSMWPLVTRREPAESGLLRHDGQVVPF